MSPELVQVTPGTAATTRWQQPFDAALTDVFQVQADIAGRVARALNVALGDSTRQELAERPTQNLAAYDAYLKGLETYGQNSDPVRLRQAVSHFEQAVALDTSFCRSVGAALASRVPGRLSSACRLPRWSSARASRPSARWRWPPTGRRGMPPWATTSAGSSWTTARAIEEYSQGERQSPSNAELFRGIGQAEQSLGRWDAAVEHLRQAQRLDPRSPGTPPC